MITYLKSAGISFFKYCGKRFGLGLSKELLCITLAQEDVKLLPFKVGGLKKSDIFGFKATFC